MYDFFAQKSNYPFVGKIHNEYRYFQEDTTINIRGIEYKYIKGAENPYFMVKSEPFVFNILSTKVIEKRQPLNNLVFLVEQIVIATKFKHKNFITGGYISYGDKLWLIKTSEIDLGPQKTVHGFFKDNPSSNTRMLLEEVKVK